MLQSIKRARKLEPTRPELHDCLARFHEALNAAKLQPNTFISKVLNKAAEEVSPGFLFFVYACKIDK